MAKVDKTMPLAYAQNLANCLVADLSPGCDRIEVAGSIRRRCERIGDIEIVCIPKRQADMFGGEADSALDAVLYSMGRRLVRIKGGDKYKQFHVTDNDFVRTGVGAYLCKLDLFVVTAETWGIQLAIRTGPAEFSHRLVTPRSQGGHLPDDLRVKDGRLWCLSRSQDPVALNTPEEVDVFAAMELEWMSPEERK